MPPPVFVWASPPAMLTAAGRFEFPPPPEPAEAPLDPPPEEFPREGGAEGLPPGKPTRPPSGEIEIRAARLP